MWTQSGIYIQLLEVFDSQVDSYLTDKLTGVDTIRDIGGVRPSGR